MLRIARNPIVVIGILLALAFVAMGSGILTGAVIGNVPSEESYTQNHIRGQIKFVGGMSNLGSDYVGSWAAEGESQTIVIAGEWWEDGGVIGCAYTPEKLRVQLFADDVLIKSSDVPVTYRGKGAHVTIPTFSHSIVGATNGDHVLKAELQASVRKECSFGAFSWRTIAQDGARLLDGAGTVKLNGGTDRFQEGATVGVNVVTGAGGPWRVELYDGTGSLRCGILTTSPSECALTWLGKRDASFSFKIPTGAFRTDGKNTWKVTLYNELWKRGEDRFFAIDHSNLAPEVPKVDAPKDPVAQGQRVLLSASARANPVSGAAIDRFEFTAWYGSTDQIPTNPDDIILSNYPVKATPNGAGSYTATLEVVAHRSATIHFRANAIDAAGRPSGSQINGEQADELEDVGMTDPNTDGRGVIHIVGESTTGLTAPAPHRADMGVLIIALLVLAVLAGAVYYYLPIPPQARFIATGLVVTTGLVYVWGVVG